MQWSKSERDTYCTDIGLHPYLHDYVKSIDQADHLLNLYNKIMSWTEPLYQHLKDQQEQLKHSDDMHISMQHKMEDLINYFENFVTDGQIYADILKDITVPKPDSYDTSLQSFSKQRRERLREDLTNNGFTNIEKLIADFNKAIKSPL